jgi:hypothetical protein
MSSLYGFFREYQSFFWLFFPASSVTSASVIMLPGISLALLWRSPGS